MSLCILLLPQFTAAASVYRSVSRNKLLRDNSLLTVNRVVAGRMAESRILMDGLSMTRQLGVIPE